MKESLDIYVVQVFTAVQIIPLIFAGCAEMNPCQNGGTCFTQNGSVSCQCPDGFVGENCDIGTDECATINCLHGGVCKSLAGSFRCQCTESWRGQYCDEIYIAQNTATEEVGVDNSIDDIIEDDYHYY